ncbi:polysaccharide biosynthesis/export family protein [Sphingorhabdus sp. EL138]|uniref:polysaccharide biosynthesis/export family protein n=1 Tax=Sphingorhabdus sp. EL138 TaxID=2073156 RepID=UPI0025F277BC|nr:polysaccharide biosynthesis/export family protein [Sphingorhabdus sp. EL138]
MNTKSLAKLTIIAGGALLMSACATTPPVGGDPGLTVMPTRDLPTPDASDYKPNTRPYLVGPLDRLTVDVFNVTGLTDREIQVDAAGKMSFPLAGIIDVAGRTPGEVEALIAQRLRATYIKNPQVTVNLKEAVSQIVTVEGQVKKPGLYPVTGRMTLLQVMAVAEGPGDFANLENVIIYRTVKGQRFAAVHDVDYIRQGAYPDPEIYPNDLVMVGDDASARLVKDLLTTFSLVSGPLVIAIDRLAR